MPAFRDLERLTFDAPVTCFAGENGSGKSTMLETVAAGVGAVAMGARAVDDDATLDGPRAFARTLRFVRRARPATAAFFRAEDAFGFTRRVETEMRELATLEAGYREEGEPRRGSGLARALGSIAAQRRALEARYGADPHARSHGETFLELLQARLVPKGLYLLDEPETPLSPLRVLSLMTLVIDAVAAGSQFVIATHSPLLMALPDARILWFDGETIAPMAYDDVPHVSMTRDFLRDPERYVRRLHADG